MVITVDYSQYLFAENGNPEGIPITYLLSRLDLKTSAKKIETLCYAPNHFHYPVDLMLKLLIIKCYRKVSYRVLNATLTDEDLLYLFSHDQLKAGISLPSPKTLHHFLHYRLGEKGLEDLMISIGKELTRHLNYHHRDDDGSTIIIDSTPLVASRYSTVSPFNPHYRIFMDKAHIVSADGYPLAMIFTGGNENDSPYGRELVSVIEPMNVKAKMCLCDGGYDNFEMYADIFGKLHAKPVIDIRENAVIHEEGSEESIYKRVNSLWKSGGDVSKPVDQQLTFLYSLGDTYKEVIGKYLRNIQLMNQDENDLLLQKRGMCERLHAQIKKVFKFDVIGCRKDSRQLYTMLNFVSAQSMLLAYLQNHSQNTTLSGYI